MHFALHTGVDRPEITPEICPGKCKVYRYRSSSILSLSQSLKTVRKCEKFFTENAEASHTGTGGCPSVNRRSACVLSLPNVSSGCQADPEGKVPVAELHILLRPSEGLSWRQHGSCSTGLLCAGAPSSISSSCRKLAGARDMQHWTLPVPFASCSKCKSLLSFCWTMAPCGCEHTCKLIFQTPVEGQLPRPQSAFVCLSKAVC